MSAQDPLAREVVEATLRDVLAEQRIPRTPPRTPAWLEELFSLTGSFSPTWGLVGLALALPLVWWLLRRARVRRHAESFGALALERRRTAARFLQDAREAERAGALGDALGHLLAALVVGLSEHGLARVEPAWTLREIVERGAPPEELRHALLDLARELDPKRFGSQAIEPADLARLSALCERHLPDLTREVAA